MGNEPLGQSRNGSNRTATPAITAPPEVAGPDTSGLEMPHSQLLMSDGTTTALPPKDRKKNPTKRSRIKIGRSRGQGVLIFVLMSFFMTLTLLLMLASYRTPWGREILASGYIHTLAGVVLILTALAALMAWRLQNHYRSLQAIEMNLRDMGQSLNPEDVLCRLDPFPARTELPKAALGWNRLIAVVDSLQEQNMIEKTEENLGQFLCSYDSKKLLGILDTLTDGIILTDDQGSIIMANRSCEGKLGWRLSEFVGQSVVEVFEDPCAKEKLQKVLAGKGTQTDNYFEIVLSPVHNPSLPFGNSPSPNDPKKPLCERALEELVQAGAVVLWVCCHRIVNDRDNSDILLTLRDITQQKISEAGRDTFIAHVSHELRSPLTNIRAYAETLLSDMVLDAQAQKESFNVINEETSRLIRLVNDILDLSHMETGTLRLDKGEVVMDRLVRQCVSDVRAHASSKIITLQTNYHPKLPPLFADREKLVIVINNILSNAIKYTPEGGTVFIETNVDDSFVYIKVTDTGIGIADQDIDRVFEKFYRVDREETAKITGSGLGLAICKEIVQMHEGTINVTSEINKGTEMEVKLPLTQTAPVLGPAVQGKKEA